jgi:signal transduction histidine kinase
LREISLRCDRRALRHAITRVLTDAMRNTRHDDWIDIGIAARADGLAVVIADEGKGTATPEPAERNRVGAHSGEAGWDGAGWQPEAAVMRAADSRGIGSRLALARGLMDAHGGRLEVEAWAGVGTKVSLVFPGSRVAERARTAGTQDGI